MSDQKTYRKPYNPPIEATWWAKNPFYFRYMLREGTSFAALLVALELLLGVFLFALTPLYSANQPYAWFVGSFLSNPIVIIFNILALLACLFHAVTWFALMPKAVRVFMNKNSTELLPDYVSIIGLYAAFGLATIVILLAAYISMP